MNLHDFTLEARRLLTAEISELLEGAYGLRADGRFGAEGEYPALARNAAARETRARLEKFVADEKTAGLAPRDAVAKLVKEAAFTHLNRLVAFKMLEARKLVRGTIDRYHESNAFKFYLARDENAEDLVRYERGSLPQDELGEGPRDVAYRHFLLAQCRELAREIRVLFDPDDLASRLFPRPPALKQLLDLVDRDEFHDAWKAGNEETIGWVYQFWSEDEKSEAFRRVFKQRKKFQAEDIAAVTQLFTPRWIVRWLVENTLGRLWVQMHPDSRLRDELEYLVPPADALPAVPLKLAREIAVLDPACGTMHFGLVAFDLLVKMYREELQNAGQAGWPALPSVRTVEEIPACIVGSNLHGIDIDLRAVQLSALTLYIKAKTENPKAEILEAKLACADVVLSSGAQLEDFLTQAELDQPIYRRIVRSLWERLREARQLGSLLRLEEDVRSLVAEERAKYEQHRREMPILPDRERFGHVFDEGHRFWEELDRHVVEALHRFADDQAASGNDVRFFTTEAVKGVKLLELMLRSYDVVVTNPPYMYRRNMNECLAGFLASAYPRSKGDFYAAFIERCAGLLVDGGRLGMITQQSFLFTSSYEKLRALLLEAHGIESMCHVGPRAFEEISGEKVNTTLFVLRREPDAAEREKAVGTYFRLVKAADAAAKRQAFERAVSRLRSGHADPLAFRYPQSDFKTIPGGPWVYWITAELKRVFERFRELSASATPRQGLCTADNPRFLRYWWEVGPRRVGFSLESVEVARADEAGWFPYMKGGPARRWYGNQQYVVDWSQDGAAIKEHICRRYPYLEGNWSWVAKNPNLYFRSGVTWTDVTSSRFSARFMPRGFVFDQKGPAAFSENTLELLGILNSTIANHLLKLVNPTVSLQVGYVGRLPIPSSTGPEIEPLVEQAISLARADSAEDETTYDFIAPPVWPTGVDDVGRRHAELADVERRIDDEVYRLYGIAGEDRRAIEAELGSASGDADNADDEVGADSEDADSAGGDDEPENDAPFDRGELAKKWIRYAVGMVLGRFEPRDGESPEGERWIGRGRFSEETRERLRALVDTDGVAVLEAGHADDLARRTKNVLEVALGEPAALEVLDAALGTKGPPEDRLRDYLARDFFKEHLRLYRKRPIYWLLQSPKKRYSIYVFHERITGDTLPRIRGESYLGARINRTRRRIDELGAAARGAEGRERRQAEKEAETLGDLLLDLEAFDAHLRRVLEAKNERGEAVGWEHEIDDGVVLNLAPLRELLPSWSQEPAKCWKRLEAGELDWSRTAMRYWPERALESCRTNKSHAIAHGRLDVYAGGA